MIRILLSFLFSLILQLTLFESLLFGQKSLNFDSLHATLTEQMRLGNRRAVRDMATFLDKPELSAKSRRALVEHTYFMSSEIDLTTASREQCLSFFYDHEKLMKFSDMLCAFYLTPIEDQSTDVQFTRLPNGEMDPSVSLRFLTNLFDSLASKKAENVDYQKLITEIADIETPESFDWLRRTLSVLPFGKKAVTVNIALCEALAHAPTAENLKAIFAAFELDAVPESLLTVVFLQLSNTTTSPRKAQFLLDSLGSMEALRTYGYERMLTLRTTTHYEKVDYYAQILAKSETPQWLQQIGRAHV